MVKGKTQANFIFCEELLDQEDYAQLHSTTDRFAQSWYKIKGKDATILDGISYGKLTEITLSRNFKISVLVKYGEIIRRAIQRWPDVYMIYYDFVNTECFFHHYVDDSGRFFNRELLVQEVCKQLKVKSARLRVENPIPSAIKRYFPSVVRKKNAKQLILLITSRIISYLNRCLNPISNEKDRVYLFYYHNLKSMVNGNCNKLIIPKLQKDVFAIKTLFSGILFLDFREVQHELSREENCHVESLHRKFFLGDKLGVGCNFVLNEIDYGMFYKRAIREILQQSIPDLLVYISKIRKGLKKWKIKQIVLNDILDERNKAVVEAARIENVKTIFVDHGIMGHVHAQQVANRSLPDVLITPGHLNPYGFELEPVPLGNPSMDLYLSTKRKSISSIRKVLILTFEDNFYGRLDRFVYQEKYYSAIFEIVDKLIENGIKLFYRPHFENREYHDYLFSYFKVDRSKINYVESSSISFETLIYDMDLLICNVTNCFFEAQAAGVPTIFLEPNFIRDALLPPFNGVYGKEVLRVSSGIELLNLIMENKDEPIFLNNFVDRFLKKYGDTYMGSLDGFAHKRIMNFIMQTEANAS